MDNIISKGQLCYEKAVCDIVMRQKAFSFNSAYFISTPPLLF